MVNVQQQILLARRARQGPGCDWRALPGLLDAAARGAPLGVLLADEDGSQSPAPSATPGSAEQHSREAPGCPQRCHSESDVPSLSEKTVPPTRQDGKHFLGRQTQALLARPGRSLVTQIRQALLLGLAYNLYCLRHRLAHRCQQSPTH